MDEDLRDFTEKIELSVELSPLPARQQHQRRGGFQGDFQTKYGHPGRLSTTGPLPTGGMGRP